MLRILFVLFLWLISTHLHASAQENFLPKPIHLVWKEGFLDLSKGLGVKMELDVDTKSFAVEDYKEVLNHILTNWNVKQRDISQVNSPTVLLRINPDLLLKSNEGYRLTIDKNGIAILANSTKGIFYGLQTLRQLQPDEGRLQYLEIDDYPAFFWRGFLLDVGRNYQPIELIKEQIDVMARYKLNVLHFHFTEDIAWRLFSEKYPGLTDSSNMKRWEGKYYTKADFKELIDYCKRRNVLFFPEIDMPGHSAAFKRFFGVDMQSDSGMVYIKELLKEFKTNFPEVEYLHIGGDEVKITNKNFIPDITKYVEQLGFKMTMGWEPGSNLSNKTYRQLWMGGPKSIESGGDIVYVDSKHLYINHMDPLESVVTIFYRKIGEQDRGHENLLGATLCSWPDRAVSEPIDMFYQNAIYPSMLSFAERSWRGGGKSLWIANIPVESVKENADFKEFENRLLQHKEIYFKNKPFPYVKQTDLVWELIGPFDNQGDLLSSFYIEQRPFDQEIPIYKRVEGGTIILRHWWSDVVKGAIDTPKTNTTWYARTRIYSKEGAIQGFWIGLDNLSRSYASDSPQLGSWDNRSSWVKVNGKIIDPPIWAQAGIQGDLEKPYIDEGYSYRKPTYIQLSKGWNEVLIKLPIKDFSGKNWQTPAKWMFTFVPIESVN